MDATTFSSDHLLSMNLHSGTHGEECQDTKENYAMQIWEAYDNKDSKSPRLLTISAMRSVREAFFFDSIPAHEGTLGWQDSKP